MERKDLDTFQSCDFLITKKVYLKSEADSVMDAMETRIKELECSVATLNRKYEYELAKATEWGNALLFANARIKELENKLEGK